MFGKLKSLLKGDGEKQPTGETQPTEPSWSDKDKIVITATPQRTAALVGVVNQLNVLLEIRFAIDKMPKRKRTAPSKEEKRAPLNLAVVLDR